MAACVCGDEHEPAGSWPTPGLAQGWGGGRVSPLNLRGAAVSPAGATEEGQAWSQDTHTVG